MFGKVKGITVELSADATQLDRTLSEINQSTKKLNNELSTVKNALKFNPTSVELWTQKQNLLSAKVKDTKDKLIALKAEQKKLDAKGVDKNSAQYRKLQREIVTTESKLKTFKAQLASIGNTRLKVLSESFKSVGDKVTKLGQDITTKLTLPLAALGIGSLKTGADFDTAMAQVAATMGKPIDEVKELRDFAKEMGSTTAFSAKQAAEGLNYMALAGYDTETSMKMLPTVLNLAAAGAMDLGQASDMVTDAQTALGLSTEDTVKLVDQMAKTASTTNTSVEQLGQAYLTVGGTAKMMKGGTAELSQVLGLLADNGIKGSEGGTALRNMLLSLSAPTDKARVVLNGLGVEVFDAQGNMRSLQDIMQDLGKSMDGLTQEQRTEAIANIFNKRDIKSVNALLGTNAKRWDEVAGAIDTASGSAQQMADTQLDTMSGSLTMLKSALEGAAIAISEQLAPYVRMLAEWLTGLVAKFNALDPNLQRLIVTIGVIAAAIGPVLIIIGKVISFVGMVIGIIGKLSGIITTVTTVIATMNPVVLAIIGVIAALIIIGISLYKNWDKIKATAIAVKDAVVKAFNNLKTSIANTFNAIKSTATKAWNAIKSAVLKPVEALRDKIKAIIEKIKGFFSFKVKTPKIPLPHFSIKPDGWKIGDLVKGKIPSLGIKWYDQGGIFDRPSVIGVGEKRPEFVGALDDLRKIVREESGASGQIVINVYASDNMSVNELANKVQKKLIEAQNRKRVAW